MNYFYIIAGLFIIIFILRDIIITTLSLQGGGRLTNFVTQKLWQLLLSCSKKVDSKVFLIHAGYMLLLLILVMWISGLWLGFFLLFSSHTGAVVSSSTGLPITGYKLVYFTGYTLSTLGSGEFIPSANSWRLLTNLASFIGLSFITMCITYFVPALSAVILQERIGVYVNSLGKTPEDILINGWNGKDFHRLMSRLSDVYNNLIQHAQNHEAYPIIFFFHSRDAMRSPIINLAKLNEALGLLKHVVRKEAKPDDKELLTLESTLDFYTRIAGDHSSGNEHPLPQPDLDRLRTSSIPFDLTCLEQFSKDNELVSRRKVFSQLLVDCGWSWKNVYNPPK